MAAGYRKGHDHTVLLETPHAFPLDHHAYGFVPHAEPADILGIAVVDVKVGAADGAGGDLYDIVVM